jgi:hypothetical protein
MLRNVKVAAAIRDAQQARAVRVGITQERVLAELEEPRLQQHRRLHLRRRRPRQLAVGAPPRAMQSIKRRVQETGWDKDGHVLRTFDVEIKLWDKTSMLHLAARHVGIGRDQPRGADDLVPVSKLSDATLAAVIADLAGRVH